MAVKDSAKNTDLVGQNLSRQDLRGRDLSDHVLYRTNLTGANLYGAKITLSCDSFDGVALDNQQVALLLGLLLLADVSDVAKAELRDAMISILGSMERYDRVSAYLKLHVSPEN